MKAPDMAPKKYYLPSEIRSDHRNNASRGALYQVTDIVPEIADCPEMADAFCFTRPQVEQRLASLLSKGQLTPIRVYLVDVPGDKPGTTHQVPVLMEGFLRHSAALLAEMTGKLDQIKQPSTAIGLRVMVVPKPRNEVDRVRNMWANMEENDERLDRTPIDTAWLIKRALQMKCTKDEISAETKMAVRTINAHLSLLALPIADQIDLHEGRITLSALQAKSRKNGEGNRRGARGGVRHTVTRNAFRALREQDHAAELLTSDTTYTAQDMLAWGAYLGGVEDAGEVPAEFLSFLNNAPKPDKKKPGRPAKKAPPAPEGGTPKNPEPAKTPRKKKAAKS